MSNTQDRQIKTIKTFNAPLEQVWQAWTDPGQITAWWGPSGFTSTIHTMDLREEGEWKLTLHGPDGTNYPNRSIFKEVIPFKKIVFEHFNPHFITTVIFEPGHEGTTIDWTMVFDTPEMYETVAKAHNAEEGQKQNIERLRHYLSQMRS